MDNYPTEEKLATVKEWDIVNDLDGFIEALRRMTKLRSFRVLRGGTAVNPERRAITAVCNEQNISRKQFKKYSKGLQQMLKQQYA